MHHFFIGMNRGNPEWDDWDDNTPTMAHMKYRSSLTVGLNMVDIPSWDDILPLSIVLGVET